MKKEIPQIKSSRELGEEARALVQSCSSCVLGTTDRTEGYAYTSFSTFAALDNGDLIFLWSDLSEHCQNVKHDERISVLCEQASTHSTPQAGSRVTLVGSVKQTEDEKVRDIFLSKHPKAQVYVDFTDFNFYVLCVEKAHLVAGFGKAVWIEAEDYRFLNNKLA